MKTFLILALLIILSPFTMASALTTDCTVSIPSMPMGYEEISKAIVCHSVVDTSQLQIIDCSDLAKAGLNIDACKNAKNAVTGKTINCFAAYLSEIEKLSCMSVINPKTSKRVNCQEWPLHPLDYEFCTRINVNEQLYLLKFIN